MNWTQFKNYLEESILQEEEENSSYALSPEAKTKYSTSKEQELIEALSNLIDSINNIPSSYSLSEDENYYSLPPLTELINEQNQPLTWKELFPKREETFFGKKEGKKELSLSVWNVLEKVFNDWVLQTTRSERLKTLVSEDNIMMKFLLEAAISLNYELIKRKGYDRQLKEWVKEYEKLEESEKEELKKQKELVDKLLAAFEEEKTNRETKTQWYHNIPWMKVIWYSAGGLLVILVLGWLKSKIKGK